MNQKKLGLKFERSNSSNINCLESDKSTNFDVKDIAKDFSVSFSSFSVSFSWTNFPILQIGLTKKFELLPTEKDYISKILRDINTAKTVGIGWLSGRFRKDGAYVLAKPVTSICNLLISLSKFPLLSKVVEKVFHKQATKFLIDNNIWC